MMSAATSGDKAQSPNFGELLSSPMLTIKASKEGESKTYLVHQPLVMHYSGYFCSALGSQNFKEGVTGEVILDDVEPCIVEIFLAWLYLQKFPDLVNYDERRMFTHSTDYNLWDLAIKLCVFADRFVVPEFTWTVHGLAQELTDDGWWLTHDNINYAFENLPDDSKVLDYIADSYHAMWISKRESDFERERFAKLPSEFVHRVMQLVFERRGN